MGGPRLLWLFGGVITSAAGPRREQETIGSTNGEAGAVLVHITGTGDFQITLKT